MEKKELLYEGKAKQVYATDDENIIVMHFKDDATAGNGAKHAKFAHKGELNCAITTLIYDRLIKAGIPTHYIKTLNDTDQLCKKVTIFPLEVIVRNYIAGSMAKRLGIEEYFDFVADVNSAKEGKQSAKIYLNLAKEMGSNIENTLVLEDMPTCVKTAYKSGFVTVAVYDNASKDYDEQKKLNSHLYIKDFSELLKLLK